MIFPKTREIPFLLFCKLMLRKHCYHSYFLYTTTIILHWYKAYFVYTTSTSLDKEHGQDWYYHKCTMATGKWYFARFDILRSFLVTRGLKSPRLPAVAARARSPSGGGAARNCSLRHNLISVATVWRAP